MKLPGIFKPRTQAPAVNVWRLQALFNNFRRILDLNNAALAKMAEMEQALGGEYIFDRPFLENSVRRVSSLVHHCVYCLNALTGNAYVPLYDRYQDVLAVLDAILAGGHDGYGGEPVLLLDEIGWELEPLVGIESVCLAELGRHGGVGVPPGFVLTVPGVDVLTGRQGGDSPSFGREELEMALANALAALPAGEAELRIVGVRTGEGFAETDEDVPGDLFSACLGMPDSATAVPGEAWLPAARSLAEGIAREAGGLAGPLAVLVLRLPLGAAQGMVRTRASETPELVAVEAHALDAEDDVDAYLLRRIHPFDLIRSEISPRAADRRLPDGLRAMDAAGRDRDRGSALVPPAVLKSLAETAMALERMLGSPVEARWDLGAGGCFISRVRPLPARLDAPEGYELAAELDGASVLARGGQLVQSGVAAGRAVHVREDMDAGSFPLGAVAVARTASPRLSPVLRMASAVVTEYGTSAGHLATVARELRLPAIFGLPGVVDAIAEGQEVTVDAGEGVVYAGVLDTLLRYAAAGGDLYPTDPEYRTLRRLLRFLMPLHLVNPDAPGFTVQGCRTMHDILHFCHDRAVEELAHFQERRPGVGTLTSRRMAVPMDMRVLDIGGGTAPGEGDLAVDTDVLSEPLNIFLRGLRQSGAWGSGAADLGVGDIFASMPRTMGMLETDPAAVTGSLAIVSADYLNLSLRTGYHFSVVDAFLGTDQSRNYVYFRFAGGLTAGRRRERRARFIAQVLAGMDFMVAREGDLVVGRLKLVEEGVLHAALGVLGALTAYCRQLDTAMREDADVERIFADFSGRFMSAFALPAEGRQSVEGRP